MRELLYSSTLYGEKRTVSGCGWFADADWRAIGRWPTKSTLLRQTPPINRIATVVDGRIAEFLDYSDRSATVMETSFNKKKIQKQSHSPQM